MTESMQTNRNVIVGLGLTGLSCARYFLSRGEDFTVMDSRTNPPGLDELKQLAPAVEVQLGSFSADLGSGDRLVMSPGVDLRTPEIRLAVENGAVIIGDIDLFRREVNAPVVAVTGTNAKSTVVSLLGEMARCSGINAVVAGNIGTPVLDLLQQDDYELYVLELSSFQLETISDLHAEVVAILNISTDHMDRYDHYNDYVKAKRLIFRGSSKAVIHRDDPLTYPDVNYEGDVISWGMGKPDVEQYGLRQQEGVTWLARGHDCLLPTSAMKIAGSHNVANALAALALGEAAGMPVQAMIEGLRSFGGLPHRCQWAGEVNGVTYYNDSKGTNPGACLAAIEGLADKGSIVLLLGGQSKAADFSVLRDALSAHVRSVIVYGEDAELIKGVLGDVVSFHDADTFADAVQLAASEARTGDLVLLSPACASFDMFQNYQQRGETFTRLVGELAS